MGDIITGINSVTEISMTRKAMNQHCTKVLLKSKAKGGVTPENPTEESEMDANTMKSFAGLQSRVGVTGMGYVAQLEPDKIKSFFEQDAAAQDAEVTAWDTAEKAKAAEAAEKEKAKAAGDPALNELRGQVETMAQTIKSLTAGNGDEAIKTKAKSLFPKVPGAYDVLKSIAGLTDEQQQPTLDMLKAQNELNAKVTKTYSDPASVEGSPAAKLKSVVKAYAEAHKVDEGKALLAVSDLPEHQELITEVRAAEAEAEAA